MCPVKIYFDSTQNCYVGKGWWVMLDGMSDSIQGSRIENLHSREVDRQSPTGLICLRIGIRNVPYCNAVCTQETFCPRWHGHGAYTSWKTAESVQRGWTSNDDAGHTLSTETVDRRPLSINNGNSAEISTLAGCTISGMFVICPLPFDRICFVVLFMRKGGMSSWSGLTGFGAGVTNLNEPLRALATYTIAWVRS